MDIVQKVTTDLSFIGGVLVPAGTLVNVPADLEAGANLADPGQTVQAIPVPVSAIGPTGPNPTMPQQVPPGVFQGVGGYTTPGGAVLVAEGSEAARLVAKQGLTIADDDDMPTRHASEGTGDATTAATGGGLGALSGSLSDDERAELEEFRKAKAAAMSQAEPEEFNAETAIQGNVPDVVAKLDGLSREQLEAVQTAEMDREKPRAGVIDAIDAKLAQ